MLKEKKMRVWKFMSSDPRNPSKNLRKSLSELSQLQGH